VSLPVGRNFFAPVYYVTALNDMSRDFGDHVYTSRAFSEFFPLIVLWYARLSREVNLISFLHAITLKKSSYVEVHITRLNHEFLLCRACLAIWIRGSTTLTRMMKLEK
jgi:hypothetical protein